jgi:hypothetical protein
MRLGDFPDFLGLSRLAKPFRKNKPNKPIDVKIDKAGLRATHSLQEEGGVKDNHRIDPIKEEKKFGRFLKNIVDRFAFFSRKDNIAEKESNSELFIIKENKDFMTKEEKLKELNDAKEFYKSQLKKYAKDNPEMKKMYKKMLRDVNKEIIISKLS